MEPYEPQKIICHHCGMFLGLLQFEQETVECPDCHETWYVNEFGNVNRKRKGRRVSQYTLPMMDC